MIEKEPRKHNFGILKELAQEVEDITKTTDETEPAKIDVNDNDQRLFFGDEFSDVGPAASKSEENEKSDEKLIDYEKDFDEFMGSSSILLPSQLLMDDSLFNNDASIDLLGSLAPSQAEQNTGDFFSAGKESPAQLNKNPSKKASDVSKWFNLFSELDPLNQQFEQDDASKNLHAA